MRRSKSASMQLSINAIVILVMAMAVLGIGLGLIRGVLAPAQDNLEEALGKVDLSETATSTKTIANLPQTVRMKRGADNQVAISYYNDGKSACANSANGATFTFSCPESGANTLEMTHASVLQVPVDQGGAEALIGSFNPGGDDAVGTKACKIHVICSGTNAVTLDSNGEIPIPANDCSGTASPCLADTAAVFIDFSS